MSAGPHRMVGYVAAALLLLIAVLVVGDELERHIQSLVDWIQGLGSWGLVAFAVLLAVGTSMLLPESVFGIAAGVLFGRAWGLAAALAGNLLGAALQYALARRLLRARIERALAARPPLVALQRAVVQQGVRLQLLVRLTPLNPATVSYLLGAAGVRFRDFLFACVALLPHLALEVYVGRAGRHVAGLAAGGRSDVAQHLEIFGGLAAMIVVVLLVSHLAHRALTEAVARAEDSGGPTALR